MKRKATTQCDEHKRSRVIQETDEAESKEAFPLNDLPDMVLAIVVRLVVSPPFTFSHALRQLSWDQGCVCRSHGENETEGSCQSIQPRFQVSSRT